jgi:hypothetical protein
MCSTLMFQTPAKRYAAACHYCMLVSILCHAAVLLLAIFQCLVHLFRISVAVLCVPQFLLIGAHCALCVQYLHRAGRLGRIGADDGGVLTTLVSPERVEDLRKIASDLGISSEKQDVQVSSALLEVLGDSESGATEQQLDKSKKLLEDVFNLY